MKNNDIVRIENIKSNSKKFCITWKITSLCNYRCDFCILGDLEKHVKKAKGESQKLRSAICNAIVRQIESLEGFDFIEFNLIGGEITILKDFPEIFKKLVNCKFKGKIRFQITTNFSASLKRLGKICDIVQKYKGEGKRYLHLSTSYYSAYNTQDDFIEKISELQQNNKKTRMIDKILSIFNSQKKCELTNVISHIVGYPLINMTDYENFKKMAEKLRNYNVPVSPIYIRNYETDIPSSVLDELMKMEDIKKRVKLTDCQGNTTMFLNIQSVGICLEDTDRFIPTGYMCDAGINYLRIDAFGNVKRCGSIKTSIGNILDKDFKRYTEPHICTSDHCSCTKFGLIEKVEK